MDNPWKKASEKMQENARIDAEKTSPSTPSEQDMTSPQQKSPYSHALKQEKIDHRDKSPYQSKKTTPSSKTADASDSPYQFKKTSHPPKTESPSNDSPYAKKKPTKKTTPSNKPSPACDNKPKKNKSKGKPAHTRQQKIDQPARTMALTGLLDVLNGQSLSEVIPHILQQTLPKDRGLAQELVYGTLRWGMYLKAIMKHLIDRPFPKRHQDVEAVIMLGLYQLLYTRIPQHAAVSESVELAKKLNKPWASGLVNGVMRRYQRETEQITGLLDQEILPRLAHPHWFIDQLKKHWPTQWQSVLEANNQRPPMILRINANQTSMTDYFNLLKTANIAARPHKYIRSALILDKPVDVTELPHFADGMVSVQDAGAQLAAKLLNAQASDTVLDACAAPGGKTGHILEGVAGNIQLHVLDVDQHRLTRVSENLQRLNYTAQLHTGDATQPTGEWYQPQYDRILLDVPCSATGVIRRHPDIKWHRKAQDIIKLVALQQKILNNIWHTLKSGGTLLYVTCSVLPEENNEQMANFLNQHPDAEEMPLVEENWGITRPHGRQILPGKQQMDGFYYCLVKKL